MIQRNARDALMQLHLQQRMTGEHNIHEFADAGHVGVAQGADTRFAREFAFEGKRHVLHIAGGR